MHWNEEFIQDLCACVKIKMLEILASVRVSWRIRANACVSSLMRETWQLCICVRVCVCVCVRVYVCAYVCVCLWVTTAVRHFNSRMIESDKSDRSRFKKIRLSRPC